MALPLTAWLACEYIYRKGNGTLPPPDQGICCLLCSPAPSFRAYSAATIGLVKVGKLAATLAEGRCKLLL